MADAPGGFARAAACVMEGAIGPIPSREAPYGRAVPEDTTDAAEAQAPVRRRRRRVSRLVSLLLVVAVPVGAVSVYLWGFATDQYVSEFRFAVRQQHPLRIEPGGMSSALSGGNPLLAVIADSEVVLQYLGSRQIVDDISDTVNQDRIYAQAEADWWARLEPGTSAERRLRYWKRMVDPFFDLTTGVVSVTVRAFHPEDALGVASAALAASERLVNDMSARAHNDAVAYAKTQVAEAEARLKKAEADIAEYRNRSAVLFPQLQATTDSSLEGRLREQLADSRSTMAALLKQGVSPNAQQIRILQSRIAATEAEIADVRGGMTRPAAPAADGAAAGPLASVLTGYSALEVEERIAEKVYERALSALQDANNEANQQLVYLDAFVRPALAEESLYPVRWRILLETALGSFAAWCLGMLLLHGIRDHLD